MKGKVRALLSILVTVIICSCTCYLFYIGYTVYKYYNKDEVQEVFVRDPDYQDWEDWESVMYTIDELVE